MIILRILLGASLVLLATSQSREKRVSTSDSGNEKSGSGNGKSNVLPIVLPPYIYDKNLPARDDSCLLYIESVSIVAYNMKSTKGYTSAAAIIDHQNGKFNFADDFVDCLKKDSKDGNFSFLVDLTGTGKVVALDDKETLFSVDDGIKFRLHFATKRDFSWNLVDVELENPLTLQHGNWLDKDLDVAKNTKSDNADRIYFGGFSDYNYACSDSPAVVWTVKKGDDTYAVGLVFNNIQLQAFDAAIKGEQPDKKIYRFSTNVNDCHGLFSVGSWMAIIVILLLLGVLSFGFLMLNSVQTMDRFDDPKQKQLIINAKE